MGRRKWDGPIQKMSQKIYTRSKILILCVVPIGAYYGRGRVRSFCYGSKIISVCVVPLWGSALTGLFVNLKIRWIRSSMQSLGGAHKGRLCVRAFIGVSFCAYVWASLIVPCFAKKLKLLKSAIFRTTHEKNICTPWRLLKGSVRTSDGYWIQTKRNRQSTSSKLPPWRACTDKFSYHPNYRRKSWQVTW
jgi:hypothetical protein